MGSENDVPRFEDVIPLNDIDIDVLREIRAVLDRYGYIDRFAVTLLHSHF